MFCLCAVVMAKVHADVAFADVQPAVLSRLRRIYEGPAAAPGTSPLALRSLGASLGVDVGRSPAEALVLVVGDARSGKSSFLNALVEELALGQDSMPAGGGAGRTTVFRARPPVEWVRPADAPAGSVPRLLAEAAAEFPEWPPSAAPASLCHARSASKRLEGVEVAELTAPGASKDAHVLAWLGARADVVVCILDPQKQPPCSEEVLEWLKRILLGSDGSTPPVLQFVLSKADLVARESERTRLVMKAQRLIAERLGRGFEILPVAAGDVCALLDGAMDAEPSVIRVGGCEFQLPRPAGAGGEDGLITMNAAPLRAVAAARASAAQRADKGLATLASDCESLLGAVRTKMAEVKSSGRSSSNPLKALFLQIAAAMALVALVVPHVLAEDFEHDVLQFWVKLGYSLACACVLLALLAPAPKELPADCRRQLSELAEQEHLLHLVGRQRALWAGDAAPASETSAGSHGLEL